MLWMVMGIVTLSGVGALTYLKMYGNPFADKTADPTLMTKAVKRGPFRIAVTERGTVDSLKNSTLSSNVEGGTTIIFIVPEGTIVAAPRSSELKGTVERIDESGDDRIITVRTDPIVVHRGGVFLFIAGREQEHRATLTKHTRVLVKEGDRVDKGDRLAGDVVCELDSSSLVEKEKTQRILVTQAEADLEKGRKNVEIQKNQNKSDIAAAWLKHELAILDLKKYEEGERIQQLNEIKGEVLLAQEDLTQKLETYEFYKRIAKKGYKSQVELESARIAVVKTQNTLAVAQDKLKVMQKYTVERTMKELGENAAESKRELVRVELSGLAALAQFEAELKARHLTYEVEVQKLQKLVEQISACKLVAPQDGKVVYAKQSSRRSEPVVIEEGAGVHERQKIISLPDFSQMKVDAKLHESKISNVKAGLHVRVRIDAFPDRVFNGVVDVVPDVPTKGSWPNMDMMFYEAAIRLTDDVSELKPGLTAEIEIVIENREDVLQAPIQAVLSMGDKHIAYVMTPEGPALREGIKIGATNDKMVEIKSGLEDGEEVVMNPRSKFGREIADLEATYDAQRKAERKKNGPKTPAVAKEPAGKKPVAAAGGQRRGAGGGQRGGGPGGGSFDPAAMFKRSDKNGDGKLTKDEVDPRMQGNFKQVDKNADGGIDLNEFKAYIQAMIKRRQAGGGRS